MGLLEAMVSGIPGNMYGNRPPSFDDPYAEEMYKASLKQWLSDNEADLTREDSRKLAAMWKQLGPALNSMPNMDERTRAALLMSSQVGGQEFATKGGFDTARSTYEALQKALAEGGRPTSNIRDFEFAQQNPAYTEFLKQQHPGPQLPAALQIAEALAKSQGRPQATTEDIMTAGKMATPESARAMSSAQAAGGKEAEAILRQIEGTPKAMQGYEQMVGGIDTMMELTDKLKAMAQSEPNATGGLTRLLTNPNNPIPNAAKQWMVTRDNLRAMLTLAKINEMKQQSATGATGLGAMSENELKAVQDSMANLEQSTTSDQVIENLDALTQQLSGMRDRATYAHQSDFDWYMQNRGFAPGLAREVKGPAGPRKSVTSGGPPRVNSIEEAMALPPGTVFITPDGRRKVR